MCCANLIANHESKKNLTMVDFGFEQFFVVELYGIMNLGEKITKSPSIFSENHPNANTY